MKAIVWTAYGPPEVLQLKEVEKPLPDDNEILVKVRATTVTAGDSETRRLKFPLYLAVPLRLYVGLRKPKRLTILGQELAGDVESVGKNVERFEEGDQVFGATDFSLGGYAEYITMTAESEDSVVAVKPVNMSYEEAAAVPVGGLEALHFLRQADLSIGKEVLINGAGGSIGTFGIQLAKYYGAEVTGVDSTEKLEMLRSIGADHVFDYTKEDFTKSGRKFDVIFDVVGKGSVSKAVKALKDNGIFLMANPRMLEIFRGKLISMTSSKKVVVGSAGRKVDDLLYLKELIEAGKIKSVIDKSYPLEEMVEAHRYVDSGQKKGSLVIIVEPLDTN